MPYDDVKLVLFKVHEDSIGQILCLIKLLTAEIEKMSDGSASYATELVRIRERFNYVIAVIIDKILDPLEPFLTVSSNKSEHVLQ